MYAKEDEDGNVEYKLRLSPTSDIIRLAGQMRRRLVEGGGEAFYVIGVTDDGNPVGLPPHELERSLKALEKIAEVVGAKMFLIRRARGKAGELAEVLLRIHREDSPPVHLTIVTLGNVDSGKSTLIGVLITGKLDDGKGSARVYSMKHPHEVKTGRTSDVSMRILGFNGDEPINYKLVDPLNEAEVYLSSDKVVTFVDLGGHEKYIRTTLRGVLSKSPDYAMIAVAANQGLLKMGREHVGVVSALGIPFFVVITRVDLVDPSRALDEVVRVVKMPGVSKIPIHVKSLDDVVVSARHMPSGRIVPLFQVSNVTGDGLDLLRKFIAYLPPRVEWSSRAKGSLLIYIDEIFKVRGVGLVVGGLVESGSVGLNAKVRLGPLHDGSWDEVKIKSIHVNRVPVERASAGQYVTLAIEASEVEKGMVLTDLKEPKSYRSMSARVTVLRHPTTIRPGFEGIVHLKAIRSPARISRIERGSLMVGQSGAVEVEFRRPWFFTRGDVFILRNSSTRLLGVVEEPLA